LRSAENQFEVRRILKAFVDAQWLGELDRNFALYRDHAAGILVAATDEQD